MSTHTHQLRGFITFLLIVAIVIGAYILVRHHTTPLPQENAQENNDVAPVGDPVFTWTYDYSETGEFPETALSLTARYENEVTVTKKIDTVQGSCNAYEDRDKDVYVNSEMTICYFAGLGYYFKVVKSGDAYLVQRKEFEEGSPEYNPPVQPFETIAQF